MNLAEICDNAKKGREYALLGNYDSSIVYYQGVIQQIHKHCQTLRDPALKVKWQQVSCPNIFLSVEITNMLHGVFQNHRLTFDGNTVPSALIWPVKLLMQQGGPLVSGFLFSLEVFFFVLFILFNYWTLFHTIHWMLSVIALKALLWALCCFTAHVHTHQCNVLFVTRSGRNWLRSMSRWKPSWEHSRALSQRSQLTS